MLYTDGATYYVSRRSGPLIAFSKVCPLPCLLPALPNRSRLRHLVRSRCLLGCYLHDSTICYYIVDETIQGLTFELPSWVQVKNASSLTHEGLLMGLRRLHELKALVFTTELGEGNMLQRCLQQLHPKEDADVIAHSGLLLSFHIGLPSLRLFTCSVPPAMICAFDDAKDLVWLNNSPLLEGNDEACITFTFSIAELLRKKQRLTEKTVLPTVCLEGVPCTSTLQAMLSADGIQLLSTGGSLTLRCGKPDIVTTLLQSGLIDNPYLLLQALGFVLQPGAIAVPTASRRQVAFFPIGDGVFRSNTILTSCNTIFLHFSGPPQDSTFTKVPRIQVYGETSFGPIGRVLLGEIEECGVGLHSEQPKCKTDKGIWQDDVIFELPMVWQKTVRPRVALDRLFIKVDDPRVSPRYCMALGMDLMDRPLTLVGDDIQNRLMGCILSLTGETPMEWACLATHLRTIMTDSEPSVQNIACSLYNRYRNDDTSIDRVPLNLAVPNVYLFETLRVLAKEFRFLYTLIPGLFFIFSGIDIRNQSLLEKAHSPTLKKHMTRIYDGWLLGLVPPGTDVSPCDLLSPRMQVHPKLLKKAQNLEFSGFYEHLLTIKAKDQRDSACILCSQASSFLCRRCARHFCDSCTVRSDMQILYRLDDILYPVCTDCARVEERAVELVRILNSSDTMQKAIAIVELLLGPLSTPMKGSYPSLTSRIEAAIGYEKLQSENKILSSGAGFLARRVSGTNILQRNVQLVMGKPVRIQLPLGLELDTLYCIPDDLDTETDDSSISTTELDRIPDTCWITGTVREVPVSEEVDQGLRADSRNISSMPRISKSIPLTRGNLPRRLASLQALDLLLWLRPNARYLTFADTISLTQILLSDLLPGTRICLAPLVTIDTSSGRHSIWRRASTRDDVITGLYFLQAPRIPSHGHRMSFTFSLNPPTPPIRAVVVLTDKH
ncbi:hypothetical protein GMRT_12615 [Giardia muris]|uniref:Uncharacterized protein n=1 Tax=Giardia muris TaxID=5742 RepID=A0A4Z1T3E9_GIAMU|nr:hypothetical protein GMRT_12615 [Giardia muris]|eukprot:TNJ28483.1 hypothetical protein GMRT_12615 [Giardia muris]